LWIVANGVVVSGQGTESVEIQWAGEGMGTVQVQEIVDADCSGPLVSMNVVVIPALGLVEFSNSEMMVYPNPAAEEFRVKGQSSLAGWSWKLMDITGRVVQQGIFQSSEGIVSLDQCAPGQYILQVSSMVEVYEECVIKMEFN
jgi:hypothetical protein